MHWSYECFISGAVDANLDEWADGHAPTMRRFRFRRCRLQPRPIGGRACTDHAIPERFISGAVGRNLGQWTDGHAQAVRAYEAVVAAPVVIDSKAPKLITALHPNPRP